MSAATSDLQSIQYKLQRLKIRFYLVALWHCLLIYGLLIWLAYVGQLALGQVMWPLVWWGLLIAAGYAGYRLYQRPSLSQIACLADQRCQLHNKLITAWQYRHSKQPVLPLLLKQAVADLGNIKPSLIFSFKLSRRLWVVVAVLLGSSWYFTYYPLRLSSSQKEVQPARGNQLSILANQLEEASRSLSQVVPAEELSPLTKTAERLQQLAQELDNSGNESQVMAKLQELKQELAQSLPAETALPEMPQQADKPALLEVEIKSKWLGKLMQKLIQQGISAEQIQNRILRELVSLMDRLIQFKLPIKGHSPKGHSPKGHSPGGAGAQLAETGAGLGQVGKGESKAPVLGRLGVADTGVSRYGKGQGQDYQALGIDQPSWGVYSPSLQRKPEELIPKAGYSYLSPRYQRQVYSVLADQHIPLTYRQQVRDYFDALK